VRELKETQKEAEDEAKRKSNSWKRPTAYTTPSRALKNRNGKGKSVTDTPLAKTATTPGSASKSYDARTNAGKVEVEWNPEKRSDKISEMKGAVNLDIAAYATCVQEPYRHMFEKLRDRADVLDHRIDDLGDKIVKKNKLFVKNTEGAEQELRHVALPIQDHVTVAGRICLDATGEGKLNSSSVLLEGSRETSNGQRVAVNLNNVPEFSLFPGQIVVCQGTNTTGTVFTPEVIHQGAMLPMARTTPDGLKAHYFEGEDDGAEVLDIMVASGPFTTSKDLDYKPLEDLLDVVRREKPQAVMLLGPFVDEDHAMIKDGDLEVTFETLFDDLMRKITDVIVDECESTELILIPSMREVTHDKVFPQPPLKLNVHKEHERIHTFSNPATITIKEVTIGVTTTDILFDLGKRETAEGQTGDRMGRLANHLLQQRSFYPLMPPAPGVNLEYDHLVEHIALPLTPDIMLLPSQLKHFVKNINGSLIVNPGQLTKYANGGTFSRIAVHAPRRVDIPENGKPILHSVESRSVVKVIRI